MRPEAAWSRFPNFTKPILSSLGLVAYKDLPPSLFHYLFLTSSRYFSVDAAIGCSQICSSGTCNIPTDNILNNLNLGLTPPQHRIQLEPSTQKAPTPQLFEQVFLPDPEFRCVGVACSFERRLLTTNSLSISSLAAHPSSLDAFTNPNPEQPKAGGCGELRHTVLYAREPQSTTGMCGHILLTL